MTQAQREAIVELMVLGIFADDHVSLIEDRTLTSMVNALGWDSEKPREIFFLTAMSRARQALDSEEETLRFMAQRGNLLRKKEDQEKAMKYLRQIFVSDATSDAEVAYLLRLQAIFDSQ